MKRILLSLLAFGIFSATYAQIDPELELWVKAEVLIADKTTNVVYARKIDGGNMFKFSVIKEDIKKFIRGDKINYKITHQKILIPASRTHAEEEIAVTNLHSPWIWGHDFYNDIRAADITNSGSGRTPTQPYRKMRVEGFRSSNLIKACCDSGTTNGIEFTIPAGMIETDLKPDVFIFYDLVVTSKQDYSLPPIMILPITGYWVDTTVKLDTTRPTAPQVGLRHDYKYARPNTSDTAKWNIDKRNAKSSTGKLFVNLPAGTAWDITIYTAGSSKVLSNTMLQTSFRLLPGSYDLEINHIWIKGVLIEKGNDTKLKTGVLHISSATSWTLYDETKEKVLINSMSQEKRGLPVGKYKLTILGQDHDIEIKDGETVKY